MTTISLTSWDTIEVINYADNYLLLYIMVSKNQYYNIFYLRIVYTHSINNYNPYIKKHSYGMRYLTMNNDRASLNICTTGNTHDRFSVL